MTLKLILLLLILPVTLTSFAKPKSLMLITDLHTDKILTIIPEDSCDNKKHESKLQWSLSGKKLYFQCRQIQDSFHLSFFLHQENIIDFSFPKNSQKWSTAIPLMGHKVKFSKL